MNDTIQCIPGLLIHTPSILKESLTVSCKSGGEHCINGIQRLSAIFIFCSLHIEQLNATSIKCFLLNVPQENDTSDLDGLVGMMDERKISSPRSTEGKDNIKIEEELEIDPSLDVDYDDDFFRPTNTPKHLPNMLGPVSETIRNRCHFSQPKMAIWGSVTGSSQWRWRAICAASSLFTNIVMFQLKGTRCGDLVTGLGRWLPGRRLGDLAIWCSLWGGG